MFGVIIGLVSSIQSTQNKRLDNVERKFQFNNKPRNWLQGVEVIVKLQI